MLKSSLSGCTGAKWLHRSQVAALEPSGCTGAKWLHWSQVARAAEAFPYFCSMKRLGVLLLPPEWDASLVLILLLLLPLKYYYYSRA